MSGVNVSRRQFLWSSAVGGGGLIVGWSFLREGPPPPMLPTEGALTPNAFLQLTPDNVCRFYCPRDEMGQGVTTGLATIVAEELDFPPNLMDVVLVGAHTAYNNPQFKVQATGGSTSVRAHYESLREMGATIRALILAAAAKDLGVPSDQLSTDAGDVIIHGSGRPNRTRFPYGRFTTTASGMNVPTSALPKRTGKFAYIGRDFPRLDGLAKSTGTAKFGIDVDVPGMHHAVVVRSPVAGGRRKSVESSAARAMPGITDIVNISSGVAVVAEKFWQAKKAAAAVEVEWDTPALATISSADLFREYSAALDSEEGETTDGRGDIEQGFDEAKFAVTDDYWTPFLAHAPMEPMNAVVRIGDGEADVWSGTQSPAGAQGLVARYAGLPKANVRVHSAYLGGGFGRRSTLTHVIEATEIALAVDKPVKVLWTREDDIQHGYFRPASLMRIRAGVAADGTICAWDAKRVGGNIAPWTLTGTLPGILPTAVPDGAIGAAADAANAIFGNWLVDGSSIEGLHEDYDFPNRRVTHATREHGMPLTYWRAVGHSYTAFAKESAIDALAHAADIDPVQLRLDNTRTNPRLHEVIRIAGERMQAMTPKPGHGLGFAAHASFKSYVAEVADVSIVDGKVRVHHVLCVIDCGLAINPDIVRAQMEGGIMFGLTAALHGELEIVNGAVRQSNFHDYPILRMNEAPSVEVIIVDSDAPPSGVGEPGLPPIAPAVANAVFSATGQRLRRLPLRLPG